MIATNEASAFIHNLWKMIITLILFVTFFGIYVISEKQIDRANELRLESNLLANELRHSSNDLTRMVRSYIATENPLFKKHYQEVLDIRNGTKPRPVDYDNVYWDLVGLDDKRPRPYSNEKQSLIDKMILAGFTQAEFDKLHEAKKNSDILSKTEYQAMALFETAGSKEIKKINKTKALELLHNQAYRESKISIMHPIGEFYRLMQQRTNQSVERAATIAFYFRILFMIMGGYLILLIWRLVITDKERKAVEMALHKSQKHLSTIIENEPECVKIVNERGQLIEMNPAGLAMLEADTLEIAQQYTLVDYLLPQWRADFIALHKKVMDGENAVLEFEIQGLKGTRRWLETHATPLRDSNGIVTTLLGITRDVTQRKLNEEQIRHLANYDALTDLPNRTYLDNSFKQILSLSRRNENNLSIMLLDLDHFKNINDTLGHNIGDKLLIESAQRLQGILREEDIIARLGGDEFIILLPNVNIRTIDTIAQKLLDVLSNPFEIDHHELNISASIGISFYPHDGEDFETLYKNADTAMYRAKSEGRNKFCLFTDEMQHHVLRNLELANALRHALEHNQFTLNYQPQMCAKEGKVIGAEALLRWNHPIFGAVSPAEFIPVLEETGLILPVGQWVLQTAISQAKTWMDQGFGELIMAVNISAIQFRHHTLPDTISTILRDVGLAPEFLELELTESIAMDDPLKAIEIMHDLHERGIRISIDDFGTGYSSLSYLKKFKIYKLKIDQSFVRDINIDNEDKAIVSAVISMAQSLGLKTIAEGVETSSQRDYLYSEGCDEFQGYLFSKPLDTAGFEEFRRAL